MIKSSSDDLYKGAVMTQRNPNLVIGEPALVVENLCVVRGRKLILKNLSFSVPRGQILGIVGPSGCGKTTLMRAIVGVQKITSGSIMVLGKAAGSSSLRQEVAYTSQSLSVYSDVSVYENVRYFARLYGKDRDAILRAIETVGLHEYSSSLVSQLSGGQASRTSLACALVADPKVLVLDEPTVGLDPLTRNELWNTFHDLVDQGVTLIVSSHVMDEAERCDSVLLMRDGHILAHDSIKALREQTKTDTAEEAFVALIGKAVK